MRLTSAAALTATVLLLACSNGSSDEAPDDGEDAGSAGATAQGGTGAGAAGKSAGGGAGGGKGGSAGAGGAKAGSGGATSAGAGGAKAGSGGATSAGAGGAKAGSGGTTSAGAGGSSAGAGGSSGSAPYVAPDFGPNVHVFTPSMPKAKIQGELDALYGKQASNQFGNERVAILFEPGAYDLDVQVGFYTHVLGLGASPDDVKITGAVRSKAGWFNGNATQNFWRAAENLAVKPTMDGGTNVWAVSQATTLRRVHVLGNITLSDGGWSSGGFIADAIIDGTVDSGTQQQFLLRNTSMGSWKGGSWNMVFVGAENTPQGQWPGAPYTVIDKTPVIREKPYLRLDAEGHYVVTVPALATGTKGPTWKGTPPSTTLPIAAFHVAREGKDTAATMNAALAQGKHLLLTPGVYHLDAPLSVTKAGTVVLGLGLATLLPDQGTEAMLVDDVDGISISGIILEAGKKESPLLLRLGTAGASADHAKNPSALFDVSCRVGGAIAGTTKQCVVIESDDVIADNVWMWRADHGTGAEWGVNRSKNGFIVNGDDVTAYGLFVEHFQEYQTLWNGERGRVYFYQSELPYDPPDQGAWQHDGVKGWASYKVAGNVTQHEAWGLGVYCVFHNPVVEANAIETPTASGVSAHHMVTLWLGVADGSSIDHIINGTGGSVHAGAMQAKTSY